MDERRSTGMTLDEFLEEWNNSDPMLAVHTSGSTGKPKRLMVEKSRMKASAEMTCSFLRLSEKDTALLCMPLDYIAGKMVVVRSVISGMRLICVQPSSHPLRDLDEVPTFAAMVPLQVYSSMAVAEEFEKLKRIKNLIIGGGAINADMEERLKSFPNAVWSTYGMTETLSHIALRRLNGNEASDYYTPLTGISVSQDADGCLCIDAPAVCPTILHTHDIVSFHEDGKRFRIIGRKDNVIDSGGIKIQMEEVEKKLSDVVERDFAISKRDDEKYGEIVVMLIAMPELFNDASGKGGIMELSFNTLPDNSSLKDEMAELEREIKDKLPKYWQPRKIYVVSAIPHTETGKIARGKIIEMLRETL